MVNGLAEFISGLVIGVGAGVTTALILGAYRWWIRSRDRQKQIPFIRNQISKHMRRILSANELPPSEPGKEPIPADHFRFMYFREFQSVLYVALSSRATALKYQEVYDLQKVLADVERAMTDLPLRERGTMPADLADAFYENFRAIKWLGLPETVLSS